MTVTRYRSVIYTRVSTRDRQAALNQLRIPRGECERGPELCLAGECVNQDSGATAERTAFRRPSDDAYKSLMSGWPTLGPV